MKLRFVLLACASIAGCLQFSIAAFAQGKNTRSSIHQPAFVHRGELRRNELAQSPDITEIINIQLEPIANGLNIVLETSAGMLTLPIPVTDGNTLVADIPNAVLSLPNEAVSFQVESPAEDIAAVGIAAVTVAQLSANQVRVEITGINNVPTSRVSSENGQLILSLSVPVVDPIAPPESAEVESSTSALRIIVTAEKTPEDPLEVPISLTVITEDELVDGQIDSIADVAANVPNFYFTPGDRVFNLYSVRGLGNSSNILVRDAVSYYIDDVPYDNVHQFFPSELFDLEQVEVLRGPQSTLYGRNSQAGVVNITSRPPGEEPDLRLGSRFSSFGERQIQFSVSDSIVPETLGLRVAGAFRSHDGFTDNTLLNDNADEQSGAAGRANLVWTPSDAWNVSLATTVSRTRDDASAYVPVEQANPFEISRTDNGAFDLDANTQSLRVGYEGDGLRFTSITSRSDTDYEYISVNDDFGSVSLSDYDQEIINQEFRLQSPQTADRFQWIAGAFFQNRDFRIGDDLEITSSGTDIRQSQYDQTTYSGFAQIDYKPVEPLTLTAGLRYEYWQEELNRDAQLFESIEGTITPALPEFFPAPAIGDSDIDGDVWLPKFALSYEITPNVVAYSSVSRGYRPGTHNYLALTDDELIVAPEDSWNYELGLKTSWLEDRLGINLTAFYNDINDAQVLVPDETQFFADIFNAQARAVGAELEVRATPFDGFDIIAGVGYTDTEFTDNMNPFTGENFDGNKLLYAPDYTYNVAMQYRSPGGFLGRFELQGVGTVFFDDVNELKEDPYAIVNARIGYEFGNMGAYLFSNNLFNTEYVSLAFDGGSGRSDLAGYGDRRTFGIEVRSQF